MNSYYVGVGQDWCITGRKKLVMLGMKPSILIGVGGPTNLIQNSVAVETQAKVKVPLLIGKPQELASGQQILLKRAAWDK